MNQRVVVDGESQVQERREPAYPQPPAVLKIPAQVISWLFHPVFIPVYVVWFLLYVHPYLFAGFSGQQKMRIMMMAIVSFTFFPLVTVLLLKGLKFIDTIYLRTQRDRVIPFIACMTWYFWIAYVWYNFGKTGDAVDMPSEALQFALAAFISTIFGLMVNIKMKVSLHAISMGIVVAFFLLMALQQDLHFGIYLSVAFLVAGLVCTARFIVSDHTGAEVYGGLVVGMLSMLAAFQFEKFLR